MGIVSILLGIITFIGFTGAGAVLGNTFIGWKTSFAAHFTTLNDISNTGILVAFIAVFGFIGLLIMVSLIMQGITYNKVVKIQKRIRHL